MTMKCTERKELRETAPRTLKKLPLAQLPLLLEVLQN